MSNEYVNFIKIIFIKIVMRTNLLQFYYYIMLLDNSSVCENCLTLKQNDNF